MEYEQIELLYGFVRRKGALFITASDIVIDMYNIYLNKR